MVKKSVDELEGGEVLARHILTESGFELMAAGTIVRKDYISRLKELNYEYVYIKNEEKVIDFQKPDYIVKEEVRKESIEVVKNVLERHVFKNSKDIEKLCQVADNIIEEIINEEEIKEQLTNIRREDNDLYTHSINVCSIASVIALKWNLSKERVAQLAKGSLLHDIGLRYTTVNFENRNEQDMQKNEIKEYRKHVISGYDGIEDVEWLSETAKRIVLLHHELGDGSGYPFKHHYSELEDEIKIVALCEAFDSMITGIGDRIHKIYEAIEYIRVHSIDYFDKNFVDILIQMVALYPIGTKVITSMGDIGIVIRQNDETPERPVLKLLEDRYGKQIKEEIELDLLKELTVFIVDTYE